MAVEPTMPRVGGMGRRMAMIGAGLALVALVGVVLHLSGGAPAELMRYTRVQDEDGAWGEEYTPKIVRFEFKIKILAV